MNIEKLEKYLDEAYNFKVTDTHTVTDIAFKEWKDKVIEDCANDSDDELISIVTQIAEVSVINNILEEGMEDFANNGCRHDLMPTTRFNMDETDRLIWATERFKSMDNYVKTFAKSILERINRVRNK